MKGDSFFYPYSPSFGEFLCCPATVRATKAARKESHCRNVKDEGKGRGMKNDSSLFPALQSVKVPMGRRGQ